ncbi:GAF domain-containing sensor histidine kinase [Novosphingobium sp. PS1R-30]|uniref:histidine kinase n=1 Tax=Novosphingobium anseongense TaxID=3133436 RepID=A0ABU8S2J0_9SPHN
MKPDHTKAVEIVGRIEAVPAILETVCAVTRMGFAAVARVTESEWVAYAVRDEIDFGLLPGGDLQLDTTICNEIRQSRQAVVIPDTLADPVYCDHHTPKMYGFRSYASYPIILSNGSMWGTLCAIDPEPRDLDRPEIANLFRMFADLIGFHLNMTGLLDLTEASLNAEAETGLQREQFIAVLGHDIRNPLASVQAGISMLRRRPDEERTDLVLDRMQASVDRMARLVDDILDFSRGRLGEGVPLKFAKTDIAALVRQVVDELASNHPDRSLLIEEEAQVSVACDPQRMGQLVSNLVANAVTHGDSGEPVRIGSRTSGSDLEIYIANSGNEISDDVREKLFQPFQRGGQNDSNSEGLGLGLYIASVIAKAHEGVLEVSSTPMETRFTFKMPR